MPTLIPALQKVLDELGFKELTPIQQSSLPILLESKDLIGQSPTGSGKTAAYALPILQKLNLEQRQIQALVICPTRELGVQVVREFRKFGRGFAGLHVLPLVGGIPSRHQIESLSQGAHIIVGTPGRILDFTEKGRIDLSTLKTLVLDEADKMLEMGFIEEIDQIIRSTPAQRQTVLFSATFPPGIEDLSRRYQKSPVKIGLTESEVTQPSIQQFVYKSENENKIETLMRVIQQHPGRSVMIFCNQKVTVAEVGEKLIAEGARCGVLHGDLEQRDRDRMMTLFRNGSYRFLVATDLAARGLDVDSVDLVINYDLPAQVEMYIHRIGRTGRAGKSGTAASIYWAQEETRILEFEKHLGVSFDRKNLGFKNQYGLSGSFQTAEMETLCIFAGRKDKLRPGDILGALTGKPVGLQANEVGKIEIYDKISYVAIAPEKIKNVFNQLRDAKIKGRKYQLKVVK